MFDNVRVYEIAEEAGASSSEVITKAKDLGIELGSAQSAVSFEDAEEIANYIMTGKSSKLVKAAAPKKIKKVTQKVIDSNITQHKPKISSRKGLKIVSKRNQPFSNKKELKENIHDEKSSPILPEEVLTIVTHSIKNAHENTKRKELIINSYPEVTIQINNLKTISNLEWNLQKESGIYAIIGENGSGKSSLLICIAKLIQPNIFHHELTGSHYENTEINYKINSIDFSWIKNSDSRNNWRQCISDEYNMPKIKGFFESSILTGTRFDKEDILYLDSIEFKDDDTIEKASDFIIDNINYVLYGSKKNYYKFNELYKTIAIRTRRKDNRNYKKSYTQYALKKNNGEYIKEHLFSTGEYFLLKLLKFLDTFKSNKGNVVPALIIIDEIELSLHPLAQSRLIKKLDKLSETYNLVVIFASHSLQILDHIKPENTFYISKNANNIHSISNPINKGFVTSKLYKHLFNDKVILVEDELAKKYTELTIQDKDYIKQLTFQIIKIGGASDVVRTACENAKYDSLYGEADVMVCVDDDKKGEIKNHHANYIKYYHHIPIPENLETYILKLIENEVNDFIDFIERKINKNKFDDIKLSNSTNTKKIFGSLVKEMAKYRKHKFHENPETGNDRDIDWAKDCLVEYAYKNLKDTEEHINFEMELENFFKHS